MFQGRGVVVRMDSPRISQVRACFALITIFIASTSAASTATRTSLFGFSFELASSWQQLDPAVVPRDPAALAADPRFAGVDPIAFLSALKKVESGQYEFYFREPSSGFAENIAISRGKSSVTADSSVVEERCQTLKSMLSQRYGRLVAPARCSLRLVAGAVANIIEVEGPIEGTWNLQGQIQASDGLSISILATVWVGHLESVRQEFDSILDSMRFQAAPSDPLE